MTIGALAVHIAVPINRTADVAGIAKVVSEDGWQLSVTRLQTKWVKALTVST